MSEYGSLGPQNSFPTKNNTNTTIHEDWKTLSIAHAIILYQLFRTWIRYM